MTAPGGSFATNSSDPRPPGTARPTAPPPNPKQQAVTFALELAKIRATLPGTATSRVTDVDQLISDATAIAAFIGQSTAPKMFG